MTTNSNMLVGSQWRALQARLLIGIQSAILDVAVYFLLAAVAIAVGLAPGSGISAQWKEDAIWAGIFIGGYGAINFWWHSYRLGNYLERVNQHAAEAAWQGEEH